jgi:Holliday junction resolvase
MAKYGKKAERKIAKVMREHKQGTLRSGGSGKKVTSRKQAVAIAISEARESGAKVPKKSSRTTAKKGGKKR